MFRFLLAFQSTAYSVAPTAIAAPVNRAVSDPVQAVCAALSLQISTASWDCAEGSTVPAGAELPGTVGVRQ